VAASSGLVQNDLKRIVAFSTISQLGYTLIILLTLLNFIITIFLTNNYHYPLLIIIFLSILLILIFFFNLYFIYKSYNLFSYFVSKFKNSNKNFIASAPTTKFIILSIKSFTESLKRFIENNFKLFSLIMLSILPILGIIINITINDKIVMLNYSFLGNASEILFTTLIFINLICKIYKFIKDSTTNFVIKLSTTIDDYL
jgi:NADH:ubiquinone oxidoreductase subunit 2 (subunit N)